ncbi:AraC family transcriptional regulator [Flavisphingomonas formosensis]|uniref:AraC family transcriptional regulator n=1 Tax=Flavisphingomonas formosensis TaxID=861534 RepID=UPI0012FAF7AB|nr:AraC family transcriptional regulator [Sphingomonas formosensis]
MNGSQMGWNGIGGIDRTIEDMVGAASGDRHVTATQQRDGWRRPLRTGAGFRYVYNSDVGDGGWEFHYLTDAISIAVVDFRAARSISHVHRHDDHLVFSAVLEGRSTIYALEDAAEELAHGFCTVYGLRKGQPVRTVYEPGRSLRWVSVFLRRDKVHELCRLEPDALPAIFREYVVCGAPIGLRSVPLTGAASLAATQVFECPYTGELRRMYLIAKSIEIICAVLRSFSDDQPVDDRTIFTEGDAKKVRLARDIIEENLEDPLSVPELARVVGLSRQKLQFGFQLLFNTSVGRLYKQVRLARAVTLVSETHMPIIEIALECGYEHPGSFTRAFKAAFGESPLRLRSTSRQKLSRDRLARRTI